MQLPLTLNITTDIKSKSQTSLFEQTVIKSQLISDRKHEIDPDVLENDQYVLAVQIQDMDALQSVLRDDGVGIESPTGNRMKSAVFEYFDISESDRFGMSLDFILTSSPGSIERFNIEHGERFYNVIKDVRRASGSFGVIGSPQFRALATSTLSVSKSLEFKYLQAMCKMITNFMQTNSLEDAVNLARTLFNRSEFYSSLLLDENIQMEWIKSTERIASSIKVPVKKSIFIPDFLDFNSTKTLLDVLKNELEIQEPMVLFIARWSESIMTDQVSPELSAEIVHQFVIHGADETAFLKLVTVVLNHFAKVFNTIATKEDNFKPIVDYLSNTNGNGWGKYYESNPGQFAADMKCI